MIRALVFLALAATGAATGTAAADTPVTARTLRAQHVVTPADLTTIPGDVPGAIADPALIVGQETRVALYAGRPVMPGDVGPPAVVERNQIVPLIYDAGGLNIRTEGRALGRGGVGDRLKVMNLASRNTVTGSVRADGAVEVGPRPTS